ncbi:SdpI family protein [Patescibacteria group bacterium]|nr:SdpI family protein [Patescibacteria group bacterium]
MRKIQFTFKTEWLSVLLIIAVIIAAIWVYPLLPAKVPSHWGINGQVDGWTSPVGHVLMFPGMMVGMYLLFLALPHIEPRRQHFIESWGFYQMIRNFMMVFLAAMYGLTSYAGITNNPIAVDKIVPIAVGVLFLFIGNYLTQVKSNFFMGIRTPWALSSEENWKKTHRLGAYTFALGGVLFLTTPWLPVPFNFYVPMVGVFGAAFLPILMSFVWFRQGNK